MKVMWNKNNGSTQNAWHNRLDGKLEGLVFDVRSDRDYYHFLNTKLNEQSFLSIKEQLKKYMAHSNNHSGMEGGLDFSYFIDTFRFLPGSAINLDDMKWQNNSAASFLLEK